MSEYKELKNLVSMNCLSTSEPARQLNDLLTKCPDNCVGNELIKAKIECLPEYNLCEGTAILKEDVLKIINQPKSQIGEGE